MAVLLVLLLLSQPPPKRGGFFVEQNPILLLERIHLFNFALMVNIEKSFTKEGINYKMTLRSLSEEDVIDIGTAYSGISEKELGNSIMLRTEHNYTGKDFQSDVIVRREVLPHILVGVLKELEKEEFFEYCHVIQGIIEEYRKCEQTENLYLG